MLKGDSLIEKGKYEEALHCYEEAVSIDPKDPGLWNKKGITLRSLGRYYEDVECSNKIFTIPPRDPDASSQHLLIQCRDFDALLSPGIPMHRQRLTPLLIDLL